MGMGNTVSCGPFGKSVINLGTLPAIFDNRNGHLDPVSKIRGLQTDPALFKLMKDKLACGVLLGDSHPEISEPPLNSGNKSFFLSYTYRKCYMQSA